MTTRMFRTCAAASLALAVTLAWPAGAAAECPKTLALGAASADLRATEEIERRIAADESLSPAGRRVAVSTTDGVVTLRGEIESVEDGLVLASLAEGVPGVRYVEERLEVRR